MYEGETGTWKEGPLNIKTALKSYTGKQDTFSAAV